jgi:NADPH:quinone reductase
VVSAVGEGVDAGLIGTRVVTSTGGSGGYAQQVAVDAELLFEVPDELALDTAVALLADGRTAAGLVRAGAIKPGERVLVEAAAGGVGSLLVQLAKAAGAEVVGAASGTKLAKVREFGADLAVDYREPDWSEHVGQVDVVFDGVGGNVGAKAFQLLRHGGRMVVFGLSSGDWTPISDEDAQARGVDVVRGIGNPAEMREFTRSALAEAAAGRLCPVVGQRFPLERAADAHAAMESRATVGKTLLEV